MTPIGLLSSWCIYLADANNYQCSIINDLDLESMVEVHLTKYQGSFKKEATFFVIIGTCVVDCGDIHQLSYLGVGNHHPFDELKTIFRKEGFPCE